MPVELYNTSDMIQASEQIIIDDIREMTIHLHRIKLRKLKDFDSVSMRTITQIESMIEVKQYIVTKLIELHNRRP